MAIVRDIDPLDELRDRKLEIDRAEGQRMDAQELAEREEAAGALAREDEQTLVDYVADCIKTSVAATDEIRKIQDHCYRVFLEEEPDFYANKEAWQSRVIVPKPFATVMTGAAIIKKSFSPDYLSIEDENSKTAAEFWKLVMKIQNDDQHGKFVLAFIDAAVMSLAIGQSMEMIPRWIPGEGLKYSLVEPWKILRDPDAPPRDPQGGMYWVHREWLDWHVLRAGEAGGKYYDVERCRQTSESDNTDDPFLTKDAVAERKQQIWQRSGFRTMHLVNEFFGTVLDKKGEVLLPKAQLTVCGGRVIEAPKTVKYRRLRWPGIGFSPFPNLISYHNGRGLLRGITSVWETMCSMQALFEDAAKWFVNPPKEICVDNLVDPRDVEDWPGKKYLVHESLNGQQAIRETRRADKTASILAQQQYHDQLFQRGSFVTDAVQGLPGYRKDQPYRSEQLQLDQGMSVYQLIGMNVEAGAIAALTAAQDVVETYAGYSDYSAMIPNAILREMMVAPDPRQPNGVNGIPRLTGRFHVSGVSALMKMAETLGHIVQVVIPLAGNPRFAPYINPYKVLKALESRTNLTDEGIFPSKDDAEAIDQAEKENLAVAGEEQKKAGTLAEIQALIATGKSAMELERGQGGGERRPAKKGGKA
jgi:hypothetical protein